MKRTTVKISDELDARLRHEAERRGMTFSELTREALESHLRVSAASLPAGGRRDLPFAGTFDSGETDISERIEEILREEMGRRPS